MAKVLESFDSRQTTGGNPPREATWKGSVLSCLDEQQAEGLIYGYVPATYRGLEIDHANLRLEKLGYDSFTWEVPYILPAVPDFPGGGGGEFDHACRAVCCGLLDIGEGRRRIINVIKIVRRLQCP